MKKEQVYEQASKCLQKMHLHSHAGACEELSARYEILQHIGFGSFGEVSAGVNKATGEKVAIKHISNLFRDVNITKHTLREIKLLSHFRHENILSIKDLIISGTKEAFDDIYIVSELMDTDLHKLIASKRKLQNEHHQTFIYQILRGLKCVHSAAVFHRDLKPNNILINGNCDLKICDFGTGRAVGKKQLNMTLMEFVTTRWYRPPEGLMLVTHYTSAVDVWSVGCILAELILRKPLFPGEDNGDQLVKIFNIIGTPSSNELDKMKNAQSEEFISFVRALPPKQKRPFSEIFVNANPLAIDLLERMLVFDPEHRISVQAALEHPYLYLLHDPDDEPVCLKAFGDDYEYNGLGMNDFREMICKEVAVFGSAAATDIANSTISYPNSPSSINAATGE